MQLTIRPKDYLPLFKPTGPLFAFIVPWMVVLIGQLFPLCDIIIPGYSLFFLIVIGNMLSLLVMTFWLQTLFPQKLSAKMPTPLEMNISERFKTFVFGMLIFYFLIQVFQIVYFKGFPLYWLWVKDVRTYFDFGIKSLNGLLSAIFLLSATGFYLIYLNRPSKRRLLILFCLFLTPILLVSRQLLISLALQIACCTIIYSPKSIKKIVKCAIALAAIFIVVGNYRTGMDQLVSILKPKDFVPPFLYPFLWIYAYVMTPFNNINANIDHLDSLGVPYYEMSSLVPSIFRSQISFSDIQTNFSLVHENMTVSTFYFEPLLDFGAAYAFVFMIFFQLLFLLSYRRALKSKSMVHVIEYSIFYMISMLSIFSNLLLYLPVISQLVILNLAKIKLSKRKNILVFSAGSKV